MVGYFGGLVAGACRAHRGGGSIGMVWGMDYRGELLIRSIGVNLMRFRYRSVLPLECCVADCPIENLGFNLRNLSPYPIDLVC